MNLEILAPCGGFESLIAAVRSGANAVYLGTKNLNARRNADNFNFDELEKAVGYCHERNVKVYVTANTLVSDGEMEMAFQTIKAAMKANIDGFIVQDLGLAKMIKQCLPEARLHASTQCSVNTPDGFKRLQELGFTRAVIPREMSLNEIKEIRNAVDIELEAFVHGALCMCVSGQCYLSSVFGGRSGNRGLCAQPCRLSFSADNSGSYDLSLKDLSLIPHIKALEEAGVISLKIEGRMKRPEYVAAAVTACKKAISGCYHPSDETTLKSVFSRSGFTDGYFTGTRKNMFGTRQKEDVTAASDVLKELSQLYKNENPLVPVDIQFICKRDEPISITVKTNQKEVTLSSVIPETAIHKPLTEEELKARLSKLGGTPYFANKIDITLDEGLIVPASGINALRRNAVEQLGVLSKKDFTCFDYSPVKPRVKSGAPYFTARFLNAAQIPVHHPFERIFIPIDADDEDFIKTGAGAEIPRGLFGAEERLKKRLKTLKALGVHTALCGNLGAYQLAESLGFQAFGDFGLNVFNSEAARQFRSPILSFELTLEQANKINADETGILAYGRLPLMITRNCPVKNSIGCEKCKKQGVLTDRKGYKFPVKCASYPCVEVLNSLPLVLSDRMEEIHTDFIHFYFTDESKDEIVDIVNMYKNHSKPSNQYTRGLYFRGVK